MSFQGLASVGVLSLAAPGLGLSVEWPLARRVTLAAGALWLPEARRSYWTFGFGLMSGSAGMCVEAVRTTAITLGGCAHLLAGALQAFAHGREYVQAYNLGDRAWGGFAPALRLGARPVGPLFLTLGVEAVVPFARYQLEPYTTTHSIFRQPAVGGLAFGGVGVAFGEGSRPKPAITLPWRRCWVQPRA